MHDASALRSTRTFKTWLRMTDGAPRGVDSDPQCGCVTAQTPPAMTRPRPMATVRFSESLFEAWFRAVKGGDGHRLCRRFKRFPLQTLLDIDEHIRERFSVFADNEGLLRLR